MYRSHLYVASPGMIYLAFYKTQSLQTDCSFDYQRDHSWRCRTHMAAKCRAEENSAMESSPDNRVSHNGSRIHFPHLVFGHPTNHLPTGILSVDIFADIPKTILITCSRPFFFLSVYTFIHFLYATASSGLLICYSIYFTFANYFVYRFHLVCLVLEVAARVLGAYVITRSNDDEVRRVCKTPGDPCRCTRQYYQRTVLLLPSPWNKY